jgi:hypothetical protein
MEHGKTSGTFKGVCRTFKNASFKHLRTRA